MTSEVVIRMLLTGWGLYFTSEALASMFYHHNQKTRLAWAARIARLVGGIVIVAIVAGRWID